MHHIFQLSSQCLEMWFFLFDILITWKVDEFYAVFKMSLISISSQKETEIP